MGEGKRNRNLSNRAYSVQVGNNYIQGGSATTSFNLSSSINGGNSPIYFGCTVEGYLDAGANLNASRGVGSAIKWDDT